MLGSLADIDTPFAVVDHAVLTRNIARLDAHLARLGAPLRPHVKTAKSPEVARLIFGGQPGPITVSTLAEAEAFATAGFTDLTYAVGLDPHKVPRLQALQRQGVRITVLLDSLAQAEAVAAASRAAGVPLSALIEVDCDGHRGGVAVDDPLLLALGRVLASAGALQGVLLHAGESYFARGPEALRAAAEQERATAVAAAETLRAHDLSVPTVSVGSTPTAHFATSLDGVTEVRAGTYVFFDLVMAGLGICQLADLALAVVVTVIGHQPSRGWIITDGGWMALSRDRGTARQPIDQGYGLVTDLAGRLLPDLVMVDASQEHGILHMRGGSDARPPDLPVGTRVRILPNHACATAAQHAQYHVVNREADPGRKAGVPRIDAVWPRVDGW